MKGRSKARRRIDSAQFPFFHKQLKGVFEWSAQPSEQGTIGWIGRRIAFAVLSLRIPNGFCIPGIFRFLNITLYKLKKNLSLLIAQDGQVEFEKVDIKHKRILYASPVGDQGKENLKKIIELFAGLEVTFLIFVYDTTTFDEPVFRNCKFIREKGFKWYFMKKYLTPEYCKEYDYILPWDDDIDPKHFSLKRFLEIMESNHLDVAQPALDSQSYYTHRTTLRRDDCVGRYTDFVEIMVQCFRKEAWIKFWNMMELESNHWGWGYDTLANDYCKFRRTGIIDQESVWHTKAFNPHPSIKTDMKLFLKKHPRVKRASFISYGRLKPTPSKDS